jgi:hypothetical protein
MGDTVFNKVDYTLGSLLSQIELGQLGLPDIQRPFVWKNAKVRDLFDSLYRGYPVGYFLFWATSVAEGAKTIGADPKQVAPSLLIVDGQQRLTALFAVVKGIPVVRGDYSVERIAISFSPLDGTFEVADAATRNDPRYITNISSIWAKDADLFQIAQEYVDRLKEARTAAGQQLAPDEIKTAQSALTRLSNLVNFPFTALVLSPTIDEEQVGEVFVRINSKGKPLNQSDFILTLMSVFWDDGRKALERFAKACKEPAKTGPSPHNLLFDPAPDQLLRAAVGYGFLRARLQFVYSLLRGKDLETGVFSEAQRTKQFAILRSAQEQVLDLQRWHDFISILPLAGIRGKAQVSSQNALLMAYTLFLLGKERYRVEPFTLKTAIAQWLFMSSLTARYTGGSAESAMESDLAALRDLTEADQFLKWMRGNVEVELTNDYWQITLPTRLRTSASRGPALFAYYGALVILDARVLFSKKKVADLLDPTKKPKRKAVERHHLYPRKYLKSKLGLTSIKEINRIGNLALVEWDDNASIKESAPEKYADKYAARFGGQELAEMYYWHGLSPDWYSMPYEAFVEQRERLIAKVIKDGFYRIAAAGKGATEGAPGVAALLEAGEGPKIEYKSTLRVNLVTGQPDPKIEHGVLKTIAGFMNAEGGQLLIGVEDTGKVLGVDADGFPNEDKMTLHFVNVVKARLGPHNMMFLDSRYEPVDGKKVLVVSCRRASKPVFVQEGGFERFYVRTLASTTELMGSHAQHYIQERF